MPPPDLPPDVVPHSDSSDSMQVAAGLGWAAQRLAAQRPGLHGVRHAFRAQQPSSTCIPGDIRLPLLMQPPSVVESSAPSGVSRSGLSGTYRVDYQAGAASRVLPSWAGAAAVELGRPAGLLSGMDAAPQQAPFAALQAR